MFDLGLIVIRSPGFNSKEERETLIPFTKIHPLASKLRTWNGELTILVIVSMFERCIKS